MTAAGVVVGEGVVIVRGVVIVLRIAGVRGCCGSGSSL